MTPATARIRRGAVVAMTAAALFWTGGAAAAERAGDPAAHAAPTVKPRAPIRVVHQWLDAPAAGRDIALRIEVSSRFALADIDIRLAGPDALVVDAADRARRVAALAPGATHVFEPRVHVAVDGAHALTVSVTAGIGASRQTRSVTLPVRTAGSAADAAPEARADAAPEARPDAVPEARPGAAPERVQSLPAVERVRAR